MDTNEQSAFKEALSSPQSSISATHFNDRDVLGDNRISAVADIESPLLNGVVSQHSNVPSSPGDDVSIINPELSWPNFYTDLINKIPPSATLLKEINKIKKCDFDFKKRIDDATQRACKVMEKMVDETDPRKLTEIKKKFSEAIYSLLSLSTFKGPKTAIRLFSQGVAEIAKSLHYQKIGTPDKNHHWKRGKNDLEKAVKEWPNLKYQKESIDSYLNSLKIIQENGLGEQENRNGGPAEGGALVRKGDWSLLRGRSGDKKPKQPSQGIIYFLHEVPGALRSLNANAENPVLTCRKIAKFFYDRLMQPPLKSIEAASKFEENKIRIIERLTNKFDQLTKDLNSKFSQAGVDPDPERISQARKLLNKIGKLKENDKKCITEIVNQIQNTLSKTKSSSQLIGNLFTEAAAVVREGIKSEYYALLKECGVPHDEPRGNHLRESQKHLEKVTEIYRQINEEKIRENVIQGLKDRTEQWQMNQKYNWEEGEGKYSEDILYHVYFSPDIAAKNIVLNHKLESPKTWRKKFRNGMLRSDLRKYRNQLEKIRKSITDAYIRDQAKKLVEEYKTHKMPIPNEINVSISNKIKQRFRSTDLTDLNVKFKKVASKYRKTIDRMWNIETDIDRSKLKATQKAFSKLTEFLDAKGKLDISASVKGVVVMSDLNIDDVAKINKLCEDAGEGIAVWKGKERKTLESKEDQRKRKQFRLRCILAGTVAGAGLGLMLVGIVAWPVGIIGGVFAAIGILIALHAIKRRDSNGSSCSIVPCL